MHTRPVRHDNRRAVFERGSIEKLWPDLELAGTVNVADLFLDFDCRKPVGK